ncbi:MAG: peptide-methionine (R)-S-oxide reductase MsrB, partial [Oscillospiraceae bacterium]
QKEAKIMAGDSTYKKQEGFNVIYLAGGCFWGMEKLARALPGVSAAVSGYANGKDGAPPDYRLVCKGDTGFKETVRLTYDPKLISLEQILQAYFLVIDPAVFNRQGNDVGTQYQVGIYYSDPESEKIVERLVALEQKKHSVFALEHGPLINFFDAEPYHQNYLETNPTGYCHIPQAKIQKLGALIRAENAFQKPSVERLKSTLSPIQFEVTQNSATERPFSNEYWQTREPGIYVDVTSGQPLFKSTDKYESSCGWPGFSAPISENVLQYFVDKSHNMERRELKSALGGAHLGHVFENDPESPNGTRYCINSASLKFIPLSEMEALGYGAYLLLFEEK